jgi:NitT/TauT family transport system substrate-binding protein
MLRSIIRLICVPVLAFGGIGTAVGSAAAQDYGKPGEPIKLTIGYQPYYTQAWSAVVMDGKQFWKKYLPAGSTAEFQVALQGAIIVGQMLAEKQDIGYMGDMPSISAMTRGHGQRGTVDLRAVANLGLAQQQCNIFFVSTDAPKFQSPEEAVKWMNGKTVAVPQGSCTDRFAGQVFERLGVKPGKYLNQNIEVMATNFRAGRLDAGVTWEPPAADLVDKGIARRVASGIDFNIDDAGNLVFNYQIMKQRPDVLRGWLQAELDAQIFMADPKNAKEVVEMAFERTTGMTKSALWRALYACESTVNLPCEKQVKNIQYYIMSDRVRELMKAAVAFLYTIKRVPAPELRPDAIDDSVAREVLKEKGLESPVATVYAQPLSANPYKEAGEVAKDKEK